MHIGTRSKKLDISLEKKTKAISEKLTEYLSNGDVVLLFGEIGTGKTTFIKYFINYLQKKNKDRVIEITSPTFNILNEYAVKDLKIMHYDLYRLKNHKDLENLGQIQNQEDALIFVEWPELIKNYVSDYTSLKFYYENNLTKRSLIINSKNKKIINEFK